MKTISVEVASIFFTTYGHCARCEDIFRESGLGKEANGGILKIIPPSKGGNSKDIRSDRGAQATLQTSNSDPLDRCSVAAAYTNP